MKRNVKISFVIFTVVLSIFLTSCTELFEKPVLSEVSSLSNVPEDDPAYALTILTDPDYTNVVKPLSEKSVDLLGKLSEQVLTKGTIDTNSIRLLQQDSELVDQLEEIVNTVESNKEKAIIAKLRKYLAAYRRIERIQSKYEYKVKLTEEALSHFQGKFGVTQSATEVYFDYENATVLAVHANLIIVVHDNLQLFKRLIHILKTAPYTEEGKKAIEELKTAIDNARETNNDDDWRVVETAAATLSALEEPKDFINSKDFLDGEYTTLKNLKTIISDLDSLVSKLVALYEYEKNYLNQNGERKDGKIRLQLRFQFRGQFGVKDWLDGNVSFDALIIVSVKLPPITIPVEIYVNDQKVEKLIDFLKLLDAALPNGEFKFVMKPKENSLVSYIFDGLEYTVYFNFGKLNVDSFDLRNNNIGVKKELFKYTDSDDKNGLRYYLVNDDTELIKFLATSGYVPALKYDTTSKEITGEIAFYSDSLLTSKAVSWTLKLKLKQ